MKKVLIICIFLIIFSGCVYNEEPLPRISQKQSFKKLDLPESPRIQSVIKSAGIEQSWIPPGRLERSWTAIVIHHSGTKSGNSAIFDRWHREGNHWEGVGYDFVIGNGSNSGDGEVEVTFRWREQKTGAHCGGTRGNWANREAVGVCLVGNFNQTAPTRRQMQSLAKLIRFLQGRYGIEKSRIYGHNSTPGAHKTDCPGKRFPMARLKSML